MPLMIQFTEFKILQWYKTVTVKINIFTKHESYKSFIFYRDCFY